MFGALGLLQRDAAFIAKFGKAPKKNWKRQWVCPKGYPVKRATTIPNGKGGSFRAMRCFPK